MILKDVNMAFRLFYVFIGRMFLSIFSLIDGNFSHMIHESQIYPLFPSESVSIGLYLYTNISTSAKHKNIFAIS